MSDNRDDFVIAIRYALLKKGTKQKFSLFFLIILSIFTITLDKLSVPVVLSARAVLNDLVYEVAFIASTPGKSLIYLGQTSKKHFNTVNKNKILEEEIEKLKSNRYESIFLKTENENLKQILNLGNATNYVDSAAVPARVIVDKNSPYLMSLIVNKGTKHGVLKGMTVFSKNYLIGKIVESNFLSSRVLLITDLNSKIPVIIEDTDVNAILTGAGKKTDLILEYLPDEFVIEPNKIIFTSGKDGFLAGGLPVAETYLNKKNKVKIKSLSNPQQALIVFVTEGKFNR